MRKTSILLVLSLFLSMNSAVFADINRGIDAYLNNNIEQSYQEFLISAEEGSGEAAYIVGEMLLKSGLGDEKPETAEEWLIKSMKMGSAAAAYNLALYYLDGTFSGSKEDFERALSKAKRLKYEDAFYVLLSRGDEFENRFGEKIQFDQIYFDIKNAYEITKSNKSAILLAMLEIGAFKDESDDIPDTIKKELDLKQSIASLERLLKKDELISAIILQEVYRDGVADIIAPNPQELQLLEENSDPMLLFGAMIEFQTSIFSEPAPIFGALSPRELNKILKKLIKDSKTNGDASYRLAELYEQGTLTGIADIDQANYYFEQAATLGNAEAAAVLLQLYRYDELKLKRLVEILKELALNDDHIALYNLALIYSGEIYSSQEINPILARNYLLRAANQGNIKAIAKLVERYSKEIYGADFGVNVDLDEAFKWLKKWAILAPKSKDPHWAMIELLNENDLLESHYHDYQSAIEALTNISSTDPDIIRAQASFYGKSGSGQNVTKAIELYDQLLQLSRDENDSVILFQKAKLLKKGDANFKPNYEVAFAIFSALLQEYSEDPSLNFELAEMYHYGLGVDVDREQAIKFYRAAVAFGSRKAFKPIGTLLLAQNEQELKDEGAQYLIEDLSWGHEDSEAEELLFDNPELIPVQHWLYNSRYLGQNLPSSQRAFALIKEGYKKGYPQQQLNYAQIIESFDSKLSQFIIDELSSKEFVPAILKKLQGYSSFDDNTRLDRIKLWYKLIELTNSDEYKQELAEDYVKLNDFYAAQEIVETIEDQERAFLGFLKDDIQKGISLLVKLEKGIQEGDAQAVTHLLKIYQKQQNPDRYNALLDKVIETGNADFLIYKADFLVGSGHANDLEQAKQLYLNAGEKQAESVPSRLYRLYTDFPNSTMTGAELKKWLSSNLEVYPEGQGILDEITLFEAAIAQSKKLNNYESEEREAILEVLVEAYNNGKGAPKDKEKLLEVYKQLAKLGNGKAASEVGDILRAEDIEEAMKWVNLGRKNGYYSGNLIEEQIKLLKKAGMGDIEDQYDYFNRYESETLSKVEIQNKRVDYANRGSNKAKIDLAKELLRFPAYEDNYVRAKALLQESVDAKYPQAVTELVNIIEKFESFSGSKNRYQENDENIIALLKSVNSQETQYRLIRYYLDHGYYLEAGNEIAKLDDEYRKNYELSSLVCQYYNSSDDHPLNEIVALFESNFQGVSSPELDHCLGLIYLKGDAMLPASESKAIEYFNRSFFNRLTVNNEIYRFDQDIDFVEISNLFVSIAINAIESQKGFSNSKESQQFGLNILLELAQYDSLAAGKYLANYFMMQGDLETALFYSLVYDLDDLSTSFKSELAETTLVAVEGKAQKLKESFEYISYLPRLRRIEERVLDGNVAALVDLGDAYLEEQIVALNIEKALSLYQEAGKKGFSLAYNRLGNLYRKEGSVVPQDINKSLFYFKKGADLGDSNCAHQIGDILYFGEGGIEKNYSQALEYFGKAEVKQGRHHALAKYKMAEIYYNGLGGISVDKKRAFELLKENEEYDDDAKGYIRKSLQEWDFSDVKGN